MSFRVAVLCSNTCVCVGCLEAVLAASTPRWVIIFTSPRNKEIRRGWRRRQATLAPSKLAARPHPKVELMTAQPLTYPGRLL